MEIDISKQVTKNIKYKNNSDFDLSITVTYNGSAVDLSGDTIRMDIKKNRNYQSYVYRLLSGTDITVSGANNNILTWSKTMNLPNDIYFYDVYNATDGDYIMGGLIKVLRNITT